MSITKQQAEALRKDAEAALAGVFEKHGLVMDRRGSRATYGSGGITLRVAASEVEVDANGVNVATPEAVDWKRYAGAFGLPTEALGTTFRGMDGEYRIVGLNTKARRNPVLAESVANGKLYVFPADGVKRMLALALAK